MSDKNDIDVSRVGMMLLLYDYLERAGAEARAHAQRLERVGLSSYAKAAEKIAMLFCRWRFDFERGLDEATVYDTTTKGALNMEEHIMQFFAYDHLPPHLQKISQPFGLLAQQLVDPVHGLPRNPERTVALRKLLESKDAAVRAALAKGA